MGTGGLGPVLGMGPQGSLGSGHLAVLQRLPAFTAGTRLAGAQIRMARRTRLSGRNVYPGWR
ncbi:hypothetical protein D3C75_1172520 [compost metagenome]